MKKFFANVSEPLDLIKQQPLQFTVWWFVAIVFGLAGFWLPLLVEALKESGSPWQVFQNNLKGGNLASFSVVILADGLATVFVAVNAGRNITAAGIRALFSVVALLLFVTNVVVLGISHSSDVPTKFIVFQFIITGLAIILASYLYCFRSTDWEKSVGEVRVTQDKEVEKLAKDATAISKDDKGVKL
ncbi:MAG: hypothetical protein AB1847_23160 [bacterium]